MRTVFECIDGHTCGNPVRVVKASKPKLEGHTMSEKRQHFLQEYDWIRQGLMFEPRGHDMMSGSILYPPHDPEHDAAILFIETSGCLPMCGHGTIGTITIAIEEKLLTPKIPGVVMLEAPAGLITAAYHEENGKVKSVRMTNVPSFVAATDLIIDLPSLGAVKVDVAYGGNYYAIVDMQEHFDGIDAYTGDELIRMGRELRTLINQQHPFIHPDDPTIQGCSHVLWAGNPKNSHSHARGAVIYGEKAIDRSPCGTGTSARMAQWFAKGRLKQGDTFIHESIIGSVFTGRVEEIVSTKQFRGIIPSIEGWARITGYNTIIIDDQDDPYAHGFQVI